MSLAPANGYVIFKIHNGWHHFRPRGSGCQRAPFKVLVANRNTRCVPHYLINLVLEQASDDASRVMIVSMKYGIIIVSDIGDILW